MGNFPLFTGAFEEFLILWFTVAPNSNGLSLFGLDLFFSLPLSNEPLQTSSLFLGPAMVGEGTTGGARKVTDSGSCRVVGFASIFVAVLLSCQRNRTQDRAQQNASA